MKKGIIFCFLLLVFIVANGNAQERRPVAVSPGSESGVVVVGQSCPTFSWSAVEWTEAYRVMVFHAVEGEVLSYEEMEALAHPVISKEIRGPALSWTPSQEERLNNGGVYVWYVQAVNDQGFGVWSEGRKFRVEESVRLLGVEENLRESLSGYGMSDEEIDRVLNDVTSGMKEVDVHGSGQMPLGAIGTQGTEGTYNTFYGLYAGASSAGKYNSFFGNSAGYETAGDRNTFLGYLAGRYNTTASYNTFLGFAAGLNNTTGNINTFLGYSAGASNTTADRNTFLGSFAGRHNTIGSYNTFLGYYAGYSNTVGDQNTFLGYYAGFLNTTGFYNTFVGLNAGRDNTGSYSTFLGYSAGASNTSGYYNTFLGTYAGTSNTDTNCNTFIGYCTGRDNTGSYNTFLGVNTGEKNSGMRNTFLGYMAGRENTTGSYNTFLGYMAGLSNTADRNTFLGYYAGIGNTSGEFNTFLGYGAGWNTTGSRNVFLGYNAGYGETDSNRLYIANSTTSTPLIYGQFDTDKVRINNYLGVGMTPTNPIDVAGGAYCNGTNWVDGSSREYKENIESLEVEEAIDTLGGLKPVKFNYKKDKGEEHVGFIAEDVPELVATKDRKGMSAMDVVAVLTKVVQEQQKTIGELQREIDELKKKNN